eukprot:sb/3478495/
MQDARPSRTAKFVERKNDQEPTETSKQPIRTRYLGNVTGCQPIRDQYFLIRSVPVMEAALMSVHMWWGRKIVSDKLCKDVKHIDFVHMTWRMTSSCRRDE